MQLSSYYYCSLGHKLDWIKSYITDCGLCGKVNSSMSRFKCTSCNQSYCVACVKPPMTGDYCGAGHPMNYVDNLSYHSCDVCRKSIIKQGGYRCGICDYDVCLECFIDKED